VHLAGSDGSTPATVTDINVDQLSLMNNFVDAQDRADAIDAAGSGARRAVERRRRALLNN
jgi:hypothetical protein